MVHNAEKAFQMRCREIFEISKFLTLSVKVEMMDGW